MKLHFLIWSILGSHVLYAASLDLVDRWDKCVLAVQNNDLVAFQESYSRDLLGIQIVQPVNNGAPIQVKLANLIHLVAWSREENAVLMMKSILDSGADLNETKSEYVESKIYLGDDENSYREIYYQGEASSILPLDLAVASGNVSMVRLLLERGAHPYKTSMFSNTPYWKIVLKEIFPIVGENPARHAERFVLMASRAPRRVLGSADEYSEILRLLENAQLSDDIDRCLVQ